MALKRLSEKATFVKFGYGQVEPNHLSAQRTAEIYAQLPAKADIAVLENGMFVKYDYAAGVCDFTGAGEWMLVYNETKVYRDWEVDHDFAMINHDYNARIYSPVLDTGDNAVQVMNGTVIDRSADAQSYVPLNVDGAPYTTYRYDVNPMPEGTTMVPRVFKTHEGDIFTTNTIKAEAGTLAVGDLLKVDTDGYFVKDNAATEFVWQVVKVYTMPDLQPGVKVMRIK